jgi:5-methylcytosine-specific restriction endonuclease McrA
MNKKVTAIYNAITGSPYSVIAPGFRDVKREELIKICEILGGKTDDMTEKIRQLHKYAPDTIKLSKQDRTGNCEYYREDLCKCYLPDSLNQCWYRDYLHQQHENDRHNPEYVEWRNKVFERDNYTCQDCNQKGGVLNAHHIKPYADYPKLRLVLKNGITLCEICHKVRHKKVIEK